MREAILVILLVLSEHITWRQRWVWGKIFIEDKPYDHHTFLFHPMRTTQHHMQLSLYQRHLES